MIKIIHGDILDATEVFICHQVNCQGVMGEGVMIADIFYDHDITIYIKK